MENKRKTKLQYVLEEINGKKLNKIYNVHISTPNSRKKVVEKMWLSNKNGMSSVYKLVQKLISWNKKSTAANVLLHAIFFSFTLHSDHHAFLWETHLDNSQQRIYRPYFQLLLILWYYLDCYIVTIWLSWS